MKPVLYEEIVDRAMHRNGGHKTRKIKEMLGRRDCRLHYTEIEEDGRDGARMAMCYITLGDSVLSSGVAFLSPEDNFDSDIGFNIALSRAIRDLVAKRLGIQK